MMRICAKNPLSPAFIENITKDKKTSSMVPPNRGTLLLLIVAVSRNDIRFMLVLLQSLLLRPP